jgi:hypothetical protein
MSGVFMRDDLHRTVSLPRPWQRVLKLASSPADFDRAQIAMTRAINAEFVNEVGRSWLNSLRMSLTTNGSDLFELERPIAVLEGYGQRNPSVLQRKILENMIGLIARGVNGAGLVDKAINAVCHQLADARVAQATSLVAQVANDREAYFVAERLSQVANFCEFTIAKPKQKSPSGDDALELIITADSLGAG